MTNEELTTALAAAQAEAMGLREALEELVTVADLRGDNELPHPADDPKLWTARMQDAWYEAGQLVRGSVAGDRSALRAIVTKAVREGYTAGFVARDVAGDRVADRERDADEQAPLVVARVMGEDAP